MTRPAAIVAPPDRNMNRPRSLKSLYNSIHIGLSTSSSITALVFFVRHLQTQNIQIAANENNNIEAEQHEVIDNVQAPMPRFFLYNLSRAFVKLTDEFSNMRRLTE